MLHTGVINSFSAYQKVEGHTTPQSRFGILQTYLYAHNMTSSMLAIPLKGVNKVKCTCNYDHNITLMHIKSNVLTFLQCTFAPIQNVEARTLVQQIVSLGNSTEMPGHNPPAKCEWNCSYPAV